MNSSVVRHYACEMLPVTTVVIILLAYRSETEEEREATSLH